jgi:DNA-binding GntR family transcriptional regulator
MVGEKGGYFVKLMTAEDVHQIREVREILELGALRLTYKKMDKQQLAKLEKICNDFTAMVEQGYFSGACEADMKFHETLIASAENKKLFDAYHASNIPLFHLRLTKTQIYMDDYEQTDKEHRQIVKALKTKNLKLAEQTLIKHLSRGEAAVLDLE